MLVSVTTSHTPLLLCIATNCTTSWGTYASCCSAKQFAKQFCISVVAYGKSAHRCP